jgi:hypothetical protein
LKTLEELLLTQRPERYAKTPEEARSKNKLLASSAVKGVLADLTLTHILALNPALTLTLTLRSTLQASCRTVACRQWR